MLSLFSPREKIRTWRKLWLALAKAEKKVGLPISDAQIAEIEKHLDEIDFERVNELEKTTRHDVMAHLYAFGEKCPKAKGILHLGATSAFVTDNTDLIQIQKGLALLIGKSIALLQILADLAKKYAGLPTVGYTHFQPAQPVTVGKRICIWLQDFLLDTHDLIAQLENLHFLGLKGASGTQASFMILLDHDSQKVDFLDQLVAKEMGFDKVFTISGQTYTRKQDMRVLGALAGLAASSHKCGTDLRLLAHLGELSEGREKTQIGSSAMPHKKNPIYSERVCSLARFLLSLCVNPAYTFATQWLERSLDDSANRRITLPEAFLSADAILILLNVIFSHLHIDPKIIEKNLQEKLPDLALENILMHAVKRGKDRQEVHQLLREDPNNAKKLGFSDKEIEECTKIEIGRASEQVETFLQSSVFPFLAQYKDLAIPISEMYTKIY